ncbi:MAG: DUF393 domain-containing protein [Pseudomonadota bacterium]
MAPLLTVWFDGGCPLCSREISLMRRLDRRRAIRFVDVNEGRDCPLDRTTLLGRFHAQEAGGPIVSGARAFAAMWRAIPVLRPAGIVAQNAAVLWLLERLYLGFLKLRPALARALHAQKKSSPRLS